MVMVPRNAAIETGKTAITMQPDPAGSSKHPRKDPLDSSPPSFKINFKKGLTPS